MDKLAGKIPSGLKHSFWSVLDAAIYPAIYMAMVPILMKGLGLIQFGLWIVLNSLMTTLQLFNLNIGLTTIRKVSYEAAKGNKEKVNELINTLLKITGALVFIVLLVGVLLFFITIKYDFLGLKNLSRTNILYCLSFTALITGFRYFDQVFQSVLKAFEYFKNAAILNVCNRIGLLLVNVILALKHASVLNLLEANILFIIAYLSIQFVVLNRLSPFFKISFKANKKLIKPLLQYSIWPWFQAIIVVLAFQTDRFWVASYAGLKEVSAYGLVATMFNHIHMIFIAMAAWMLPRISSMIAKGENPNNIYYQVRGILVSIGILSLLCFYFIAPIIFPVWVGSSTYLTMAIYIKAFIVFELLFLHTIMPFFFLNASDNERVATLVTLSYSLACYIFMVVGLLVFKKPVYLIHGMSLSLCITMPLMNFIVSKRMVGTVKKVNPIQEMIPVYLTILLIYVPFSWLKMVLIPLILVLVFQNYLKGIVVFKNGYE